MLRMLPVLAALVLLSGFATAGALFLSGNDALTRLGLLMALLSTGVLSLTSLLKADDAARNTDSGSRLLRSLNGGLNGRLRAAVRDVRDEPYDSVTPAGEREAPDAAGPLEDKAAHE